MATTMTFINQPIKLNFGKITVVHDTVVVDPDPKDPEQPAVQITSYKDLTDKPSIEGVVLVDDKTLEDLGISKMSRQQALDIAKKAWD